MFLGTHCSGLVLSPLFFSSQQTGHMAFKILELLGVIQVQIQDVDAQYIVLQMDGGCSRQQADHPDEDYLGHRVNEVQGIGNESWL